MEDFFSLSRLRRKGCVRQSQREPSHCGSVLSPYGVGVWDENIKKSWKWREVPGLGAEDEGQPVDDLKRVGQFYTKREYKRGEERKVGAGVTRKIKVGAKFIK